MEKLIKGHYFLLLRQITVIGRLVDNYTVFSKISPYILLHILSFFSKKVDNHFIFKLVFFVYETRGHMKPTKTEKGGWSVNACKVNDLFLEKKLITGSK